MADPKWKRLVPVTDKIVPLLANALVGGSLLDRLLALNVVSYSQYDELSLFSENPRYSLEDRSRKLLECLRRRPPPSFDAFCAALQKEDRKAVYDLLVTSATATEIQFQESAKLPCKTPVHKTPIARVDNVKENSSSPKRAVDGVVSTTSVAQGHELPKSSRPPYEELLAQEDDTRIACGEKCSPNCTSEPQKTALSRRPATLLIFVQDDLKDAWEPTCESFLRIVESYAAAAHPERKISVTWKYVSKMTFFHEIKSDRISINKESDRISINKKCLVQINLPKTTPEDFEKCGNHLLEIMSNLVLIKIFKITSRCCIVHLTFTANGFIHFICGLNAASNFAHLIIFDSCATLQIGSLPPVKLAALLRFGEPQSVSEAFSLLEKVGIEASE